MQDTGNLNSLTDRMKATIKKNQQETAFLIQQQFDALSKSLSESSKNALDSTGAAILTHLTSLEQSVTSRCRILSAAFGKKCLQALLITLLITLGILTGATLGGWGLLTLAGNKVTSLHQEITTLSERKEALEKTVAQLEDKTWGLTLVEDQHGRFIVLPLKTNLKPGWTLDKAPAWKLE